MHGGGIYLCVHQCGLSPKQLGSCLTHSSPTVEVTGITTLFPAPSHLVSPASSACSGHGDSSSREPSMSFYPTPL